MTYQKDVYKPVDLTAYFDKLLLNVELTGDCNQDEKKIYIVMLDDMLLKDENDIE